MARGSIRKHERASGVRYEVVVDFGADPLTGKRRQRTKSFKTRREAQAMLVRWMAEIERGTVIDRSSKTVAEIMSYWIDTHARPRLRAKTVADYENIIKNHILPGLGRLPVQQVTPETLLSFYARETAAGVGARTLRLCHILLRQALAQAATIGLVPRNVATLVKSPKVQRREMQVWDVEQVQAFLAVAPQSIYGPIWTVALTTGLRRGELLGLRWRDVDVGHRVLHVRQSIGAVHGHIEIKQPKTRSSVRTVAIPEAVVTVLAEHRRQQDERRQQLGAVWHDHDLVFTIPNGKPIHPDSVQHDFRRLVQLAGVPYIRIHDLRHTYVTLAYRHGASIKAISETVGHAGIGITLEVYAHLLADQRREVADTLGTALFGKESQATDNTEADDIMGTP